jgi:hypothetical protein
MRHKIDAVACTAQCGCDQVSALVTNLTALAGDALLVSVSVHHGSGQITLDRTHAPCSIGFVQVPVVELVGRAWIRWASIWYESELGHTKTIGSGRWAVKIGQSFEKLIRRNFPHWPPERIGTGWIKKRLIS